jgi:hypothetical protein
LRNAPLGAGRNLGSGWRSFAFLEAGVLPLKPLHTASTVYELLFTREEWMALGADFQVQDVALIGRTRLDGAAARANDRNIMVIGVNTRLHRTPFWQQRNLSF